MSEFEATRPMTGFEFLLQDLITTESLGDATIPETASAIIDAFVELIGPPLLEDKRPFLTASERWGHNDLRTTLLKKLGRGEK